MPKKEKRTPVSLVRIDLECEMCGKGYMSRTGMVFPTSPPKYEHACNKCGAKAVTEIGYPYFSYEEI